MSLGQNALVSGGMDGVFGTVGANLPRYTALADGDMGWPFLGDIRDKGRGVAFGLRLPGSALNFEDPAGTGGLSGWRGAALEGRAEHERRVTGNVCGNFGF